MMMWLFKTLTQNAWLLAFIGAHFIFFSVPAWGVIAARIGLRRIRRGELLLLSCFVLCVGVEIFQLVMNGRRAFGTGSLWGYARYFGAIGPLLWVWAAVGLALVWRLGRGYWRLAIRAGVVLGLMWLFYGQTFCYLRDECTCSGGADAWVAAKRVAPIIKADYKGPKTNAHPGYTGIDYFTAARPIVFSNIGAAAWEVRGACEGVRHGFRHWVKEDYLFVRVGEGYYGKLQFSGADYDFVTKVDGLFCEWVLLRRKNVNKKR